jgi:hypothetical protein
MALITLFPRLLSEVHSAGAYCQNAPSADVDEPKRCGRFAHEGRDSFS